MVFIDSDAVFANMSVTVQSYLQSSELTLPQTNPLFNSTLPDDLSKEDCRIFVPRNDQNNSLEWPNKTMANAGVHFWTEPFDRAILADWWRADVHPQERQWEQDALNELVLQQHPRAVCSLDDCPFRLEEGQYIWHFSEAVFYWKWTGATGFLRKAFPKLARSSFHELMLDLKDHIREMPQDALDAAAATLD